jgi:hypothetical protein
MELLNFHDKDYLGISHNETGFTKLDSQKLDNLPKPDAIAEPIITPQIVRRLWRDRRERARPSRGLPRRSVKPKVMRRSVCLLIE